MKRHFTSFARIILAISLLTTVSAKAELVGYWPLEGDLKDASNTHNDGVAKTGTPAFVTDVPKSVKSTKALSLADSATVHIPHQVGLLDGQTMTISFWLNAQPDSPGLWSRVISKTSRIEKGSVGLEIQRNAQTPQLHFRFDTPKANNQHGPIGNILDGTWHHIVIVVDGKKAMTYVDAKKPLERTLNTELETPLANSGDLILGQSGIEKNRFFTGMIDDVAVWNTALTAEQIKSLTDGSATPMDIK